MTTESADVTPESEQRVTTLPMGCYYATQSREETSYRLLLRKILANDVTPPVSLFTDTEKSELEKMRDAGLITFDEPQTSLPLGNLRHLMQYALPALSAEKKVVFSDSHHALILGFTGYKESQAEELAVLAAQMLATEKLNQQLKKPTALSSHTIGLIDPAGNSNLGFWPIHVAEKEFCLTIAGPPRFNTSQFALLVWGLVERYGQNP